MDIKKYIQIVEDNSRPLINTPYVIALDASPYQLSRLMQQYRGDANLYNSAGDNSLVTFYTEQEREEFEKYLKRQGVKFWSLEKTTQDEDNTKSVLKPYKD